MKPIITLLALGMAWSASFAAPSAPEGKQSTNADVTIENPPESGSNAKPKRKPSTSGKTRSTVSAEMKSFTFSDRNERLRPLVVRSGESDMKMNGQLQEDLAVMSRILEKAVAEFRDEHEEAAGIPIVVLAGGRSVRAMYLEDYGAIFTLTMNIPLRAELKLQEAEEKAENVTNEEWNEARNELFGERRVHRGDKPPRRELDAHQVEEFRGALIEALRNAANIRAARSTDWITLVVRGRGSEEDLDRKFDVFLQSGNGPGREAIAAPLAPAREDRIGDLSTMVLRVKKSDVDQVAKQKQTLEEFKKKVSISLY